MTALVQVRDGQAMASSIDVARAFEKQHQHVMRAIRALVEARQDLASNFGRMIQRVETGKMARRDSHYYEMDRKGFTILAMGFTGPKALDWKVAFYDAFEQLELALRAASNDDDDIDDAPLAPPLPIGDMRFVDRLKYEPPNIQLAYVREMRMAKGRPGAIVAMRELGWEAEEDPLDPIRLLAASDPVARQVLDWVRDRTEPVPGHRIRTTALYNDFVQWAVGQRQDALSMKAFSQALTSLGYPGRRSDVSYKIGLRLRSPH